MHPQIHHVPVKTLCCGSSGTGKTTLMIRRIAAADALNVFIFDQAGELTYRLGLPILRVDDLTAIADAHRVVCVDPADLHASDLAAAFEWFCLWVLARSQQTPGRKLLVIDELQRLTTTHADGAPKSFVDILEIGRRAGLDVLIGSQAPNLLHNRIRAQITEVCAFRMIDKRATDWLEPLLTNADDRLRNLPRGLFICRNLNTGDEIEDGVF